MQTKLTLSVDQQIIEQAKAYAKKRGISLSKLVQEFLKQKASETEEEIEVPEKYQGIYGAFELPDDFDYKKEIGKALAEKYERLG